jgi:hypothetical protein
VKVAPISSCAAGSTTGFDFTLSRSMRRINVGPKRTEKSAGPNHFGGIRHVAGSEDALTGSVEPSTSTAPARVAANALVLCAAC